MALTLNKVIGNPRVGRQSCVKLSVKNPLPERLNECLFAIEGASLTNGETLTRRIVALGPNEKATAKFYFMPTQNGQRKLLVDFYSTKLGHVKSFQNLYISN